MLGGWVTIYALSHTQGQGALSQPRPEMTFCSEPGQCMTQHIFHIMEVVSRHSSSSLGSRIKLVLLHLFLYHIFSCRKPMQIWLSSSEGLNRLLKLSFEFHLDLWDINGGPWSFLEKPLGSFFIRWSLMSGRYLSIYDKSLRLSLSQSNS